jgi:heme exporter protein CcmD
MANFFAMGGYAVDIWPAYAVTALVLLIATAVSLKAHARAKNAVRRLEEEAKETNEKESP